MPALGQTTGDAGTRSTAGDAGARHNGESGRRGAAVAAWRLGVVRVKP
jgi:hypothetical protein